MKQITKEQLLKMADSQERPEDAPPGSFCRAGLQKQGMTQVQASALISRLGKEGMIRCVGKYRTRKLSGDWNSTPFYEVVK